MSRDLVPNYQFGEALSALRIDEDEINTGKVLQQGEEVTIWSDRVPADKIYVWGIGPRSREASNTNFVFADFQASGSGTGTSGNTITDCDVVIAVTDSTQEDTLAKTTLNPDAGDLSDAQADNRTERPVLPEQSPGATEDKHLELRLRARSGADGKQVATSSVLSLAYAQLG